MPSNGLPALRPEHVPMERRSSMDPRHKATNAMSLSFIIEQDDSALANATGNSAPSSSKEPKEMSPARQEVTMFSGSLLELWKQFFSMHKTISTLQAELKVIRYQLAEIGKQKTETSPMDRASILLNSPRTPSPMQWISVPGSVNSDD